MTTATQRSTQAFGPLVDPGTLRLSIVSGPCPTGVVFVVDKPTATLGRDHGDVLLSEDGQVNPSHALLSRTEGRWVIQDNGSVNGIYQRLRAPVPLRDGDWIRTGEHYFRFHLVHQGPPTPNADGTIFAASPETRGSFRLQQVLRDGLPGLSAAGDDITIGREGANIAFNADPFLSTRHARVYRAENGNFMLEDAGSRNGTYLRLREPSAVSHGDLLFIGSTLLRADLT